MEGGRSTRGQAGDLKYFALLIPITRLGLCDGRLKSAKNETARLVYRIHLRLGFMRSMAAEPPFSGSCGLPAGHFPGDSPGELPFGGEPAFRRFSDGFHLVSPADPRRDGVPAGDCPAIARARPARASTQTASCNRCKPGCAGCIPWRITGTARSATPSSRASRMGDSGAPPP